MVNIQPFSDTELLEAFYSSEIATSKHLLTIYSLAIGLNAKIIIDLGIGSTTKALRAAALKTGGVVMSCDCDVNRFSSLLKNQDKHWQLYLGASETFLKSLEQPFDLVVHDAAHDYFQVKLDLELILPKMKTFGIICVHDTQQTNLCHDMLAAIRDATNGYKISLTHLPFNAGLSIIRIEEGNYPSITPNGSLLKDGLFDTQLISFHPYNDNLNNINANNSSLGRWLRWRLRKLIKGW
ncbi:MULTISPECIES: class I SAM-dependent methyltransferase [unclassified Coleofasciculus]|uniref:class I SAM-dependent methyltransferase n=1 Tax=Cyanophyceae TaxID=3028117 RepID=UPI001684F3E5|nr:MULTISPECIES: class I SAM-dependent methyltransferase [unclassified Coleofasciculus]MBD1896894.1 class I SAM-dependent methyltransferase [Coleofasciculus sp. FACHB-129]MBD2087549.1 class I SAM-dependent methyltransferase [Coleofasciculus sp. FACHB-542]